MFVDGKYSIVDKTNENTIHTNYYNEDRENELKSKNTSHTSRGVLNTAFDFSINKKNKLFFENNYSESNSDRDIEKEQKQIYNKQEILNSQYTIDATSNSKKMNTNIVSRSLLSPQAYLELNLKSLYSKNESSSINKGIFNSEQKEQEQKIEQLDHKLVFKPKFILYKNCDHIYRFNHELVYQQAKLDDQENKRQLNYLANTFNFNSTYTRKYFQMTYSLGYRLVKSIDSPIDVKYRGLIANINTNTKLGDYKLIIGYSRETSTPTINQLFDFYDRKNPFYVRIGNVQLKPEEINNFDFSFNKNEYSKITYSFNYKFINNYIVNSNTLVTNGKFMGKEFANGTLVNRYQNTNGYWGVGLKTSIMLPIRIFLNYNFSYVPNFYNGIKNNSKSNNYALNLNWSYFRNKIFTFNLSSNNSYTHVNNSTISNYTHYLLSYNSLRINIRKILGTSVKIQYNNLMYYSKIIKSQTDIKNFIDLSIRKPILKSKFDLSFVVKDLLDTGQTKQNRITKDYFRQVDSNLESRIFLVKLSYIFRNVPSTNYNTSRSRVNSINKDVSF